MKKRLLANTIVLVTLLAGCAPTDAKLEEEGWVKNPADNGWVLNPGDNGWVLNPGDNGWVKNPADNGWVLNPGDNGWVTEDELTPSPVATDAIVHWVPGAEDANVSWNLDLKGANSLNVVLGGKLLTEWVDYTFDKETGLLEITGVFLTDSGLGLGDHTGYVFTENGSTEIKVHIVSDPTVEGSTIPLKEVQDINLSAFETMSLSTPIANTADLFITEIGVDMGNYGYVEVFNNTNADYNLKNHRIVFADLAKQDKGIFTENGLIEEPYGMYGGTFIYQDYIVPALSSAIIWIVNTEPWSVEATGSPRKVLEADGAESMILGNKPGNLNVSKFRSVYGLNDDVLVFPSRINNFLVNGATSEFATNGYGLPVKKTATWSFNSKMDNRIAQIQKVTDTIFTEGEGEEAKYYKYEMNVINREEDIYEDGVLDENDVFVADTTRQSIHALYAKKVYVTSASDATPTGAAGAIDMYNADKTALLDMLKSGAIVPVSTAFIYPHLAEAVDENENVSYTAAKWGDAYSQFALQYAAPIQGSHYARFIPLEGTTTHYQTFWANDTYKTIKLDTLAAEVVGYGATTTVKVPVDSAYPTSYLAKNHNTAGRVTSLSFPAA